MGSPAQMYVSPTPNDATLVDCLMPGLNGYRATTSIRACASVKRAWIQRFADVEPKLVAVA
jgi:hypothetical protein